MSRDFTSADNRILAAMAAGCQLTRWSYYANPRHNQATLVLVLLHPDGRRRHISRREGATGRLQDAGAIVREGWIDDWDGLSKERHILYSLTDAGRARAATGSAVDLDRLFAPGPHVTTPLRDHMAVYRNARERQHSRIILALDRLGYKMGKCWF